MLREIKYRIKPIYDFAIEEHLYIKDKYYTIHEKVYLEIRNKHRFYIQKVWIEENTIYKQYILNEYYRTRKNNIYIGSC
ncbi:MAG: hypothetical protein GY714_20815 [Desulfobacterales bacterium]|nr:hypothetical protein [Desulfobacterales bacterium]